MTWEGREGDRGGEEEFGEEMGEGETTGMLF